MLASERSVPLGLETRLRGQSVLEYVLLIGLISVAVALSLMLLGVRIEDLYCGVAEAFGVDGVCSSYLDEDFSDISDWSVERGKWGAEGGRLLGGGGEGRIFHAVPTDDYTITLSATNLSRGDGYGVWFRTDPGPPLNGYTMQYDPGWGDGAFIYRRWVNGYELSPFAVQRMPDFDWHGTDHEVQIVVQGDTFQTVVDGEVVLEAQDDTWTTGQIGLRTWDGSELAVDHVTVTP